MKETGKEYRMQKENCGCIRLISPLEKWSIPMVFMIWISLFQGKLVKYFSRQLSCKCKVALEERSTELEDFPRLELWFRIVNLRKEVIEVRPGLLW